MISLVICLIESILVGSGVSEVEFGKLGVGATAFLDAIEKI